MGFSEARVLERHPWGLSDALDYPLFTPDLIELMRKLLGPEQQKEVATAITVRAVKPT